MRYREIISQLENRERFGFKFGLTRIRKFLKKLNHPEKNLRIIHITGTNGKGSTAAFIAKILESARYRVGLYTSPHLIDIRERIQINNQPISKKDFVSLFYRLSRLRPEVHRDFGGQATINYKLSTELTYFEFLTALAFQHFFEKKVDFLVLEVGLGGRLDATNVIRKPLVSLITNIDYEHTEYLGKKLQKIAYEKAGIIKRNSITITGVKQKNLLSLFKEICLQRKNRLFSLRRDFRFFSFPLPTPHSPLPNYQSFNYQGIFNNYKNLRIKLLGRHQVDNACLAIATIEVLKFHGIYVPEYAIREGLRQTFWPGRLEVLKLACPRKCGGEPRASCPVTIILDGAHNPAGIDVLKESLSSLFPKKKIILILGVLADKDIGQMIKKIAFSVDEVILTKPNYYRAAEPEILYKEMKKYLANEKIFLYPTVKEALNFAFSRIDKGKDIIVVTGSLYTVAEARKILK